jgi:hypothetical protein
MERHLEKTAMTIACAHLVDIATTRWHHCVTRCVRRAFLLGEGPLDRKEWIDQRLEELAKTFAVSVGGSSVMDNHLHLLVRLDPEIASGWTDEEVVRRWGRLFKLCKRFLALATPREVLKPPLDPSLGHPQRSWFSSGEDKNACPVTPRCWA